MTQTQGHQQDDQPIYTPSPESDKHWMEPDPNAVHNALGKMALVMSQIIKWPADWFRANVVEPNRGPKYYWFHRRFPRVLPIDECYIDDEACFYEAELEYQRVKKVDKATLELLRIRRDSCLFYYKEDSGLHVSRSSKCKDIEDTYEREELNFFIKYGEMPFRSNVMHAYTKQKHRMIMERRKAQKEAAMAD